MVDKSKDPEFWAAVEKYNKIYQEKREEMAANDPMKLKPMTKEEIYGDCDHPNTMENAEATILYIIIMLVGAIFYDRLLIWIVATGIWLCHIFRHQIRKK